MSKLNSAASFSDLINITEAMAFSFSYKAVNPEKCD